MSQEDLTIRMGLKGQAETARGIDQVADAEKNLARETKSAQAASEQARRQSQRTSSALDVQAVSARSLGRGVRDLESQTRAVSTAMATAGRQSMQTFSSGLGFLRQQAQYGALGLAGLAVAGTAWGLSFNAQVDSARIRFGLFTDDVSGLTAQVRQIDKESTTFGFAQLANSAAMLGGSGIKDVAGTLRGVTNAAAAGGKGAEGLNSIALALSQIQGKGVLQLEELRQLAESGGVPGVMDDLAKGLGMTQKDLLNVGNAGIDATKAIDVLTAAWTSGKMADAAKKQGQSLAGQWSRTTSNMQAAAGAATKGLADGLTRDILPASNRAIEQITALFGDKGLSDRQKLQQAKQIIRTELGPIAKDLAQQFRDSGLDKELEDAFEAGMSKVASTAISAAPKIVSGFVDAWLGAGPWAKLISGAWLGHKLGLDKGALKLIQGLRGKGGAAGVADALGGRGQVPLKPLYVWVVGEGMASVLEDPAGAGRETPAERSTRLGGRGGKLLSAIKATPILAAEAAPPLAAATGIALVLNELFPNFAQGNLDSRAGGAAVRRQADRSIPAPGFGGGMPGALNVTVQVGEEQIARANIRGDDHMLNRAR